MTDADKKALGHVRGYLAATNYEPGVVLASCEGTSYRGARLFTVGDLRRVLGLAERTYEAEMKHATATHDLLASELKLRDTERALAAARHDEECATALYHEAQEAEDTERKARHAVEAERDVARMRAEAAEARAQRPAYHPTVRWLLRAVDEGEGYSVPVRDAKVAWVDAGRPGLEEPAEDTRAVTQAERTDRELAVGRLGRVLEDWADAGCPGKLATSLADDILHVLDGVYVVEDTPAREVDWGEVEAAGRDTPLGGCNAAASAMLREYHRQVTGGGE